MTIFELGALGEFVGSIAVVVTLIYLAVQIKQNTAATHTNTQQFFLSAYSNLHGRVQTSDMAIVLAKVTETNERLEPHEVIRLRAWLAEFGGIIYATKQLENRGVITSADYQREVEPLKSFMEYPLLKRLAENTFRDEELRLVFEDD